MVEQTYPIRIVVSTDGRGLTIIQDGVRRTTTTVNELERRSVSALGSVSNGFSALKTALAGLGLGAIVNDAMNTYRSFESMQASLKTVTGSAEAGAAAFESIKKFAAETPFTLDQSVQGFQKLKALGLDPSMSSLRSYGNTAAAMGKDMMQMIEAVADASTGEFERLKEFGIKSKVAGDKVAFTFQGVTTEIGNNSKAIQDYLLKIGNTTFGTAMSDQAQTLNGKISNLKDSWAAFQVKLVEQTGAAELAKVSIAALAGMLESASGWIDGAASSWALFVENFRSADTGIYAGLRESLDGVSIGFERIINASSPAYDAIVNFMTSSVSASDALQILADISGAAGLALQDIAVAIEWLIAKAVELGVFETVSGWFAELSQSAESLSPYITEFVGTFGAFVAVSSAVAAGLSIVSAAVTALGAVLMLNPVVAIIAGIATAAYLLHEHWDAVSAWWSGVWGDISSAAGEFANWWNSTTLAEKRADIDTWGIELGKSLAEDFISWWDGSALKEWLMPVTLDALEYAQQRAVEFSVWWDSWTVKEVVANVTADVLIWAWEHAKALSAWWDSWTLPEKTASADATLIERAWEVARRFKEWWDSLSLKSLMPEINISGAIAKAKSVGSDIISGLTEGISRATSHISAANKAAGEVEEAMNTRLDRHSPSKVTEAIGADTANGLALGIDKNASKASKAAEKAAAKVADAFSSIMDGLNKQLLELTQGEEVARRYELTQQKIVGVNQEAVIAIESQIKAAEAYKKKTEEVIRTSEAADKAYADTMERLQGQTLALTDGEEAGERYKLKMQGITGANQDAVIAAQQHIDALAEHKKKTEEVAAAVESAQKAAHASAQALEIASKSLGLNDEQLQAMILSYKQGYTPELAAAQAATEAKAKSLEKLRTAQINANEAVSVSAHELGIAQQALSLTDNELRALVLTHEEGYSPALAKAQAATESQTKAFQGYRSITQDLTQKKQILEARLRGGEKAARAMELSFKDLGNEQINNVQSLEAYNQSLERTVQLAAGIGDALANGLFSGDWKAAGQSILGELKVAFVDPLKKQLSSAISQALSGSGSGGGLFGAISQILNLKGIGSAVSNVGSSVGSLFSGIAASAANGFTGLGTAISGGLSGIMGSFGSLVSAIPVWGWAIGGLAAAFSIFGKKEGNLVFGQGMSQGQQLTGQGGHAGKEHWRETAFGLVGATSGSNKIGREKGFVPEFHKALDLMVELDGMLAKALPDSINKIKKSLDGLEVKGFSIEDILKQRYSTVLSALSEELQKAFTAGKDITKMSAEEIVARFKLLADVTQSGLVPALDKLGWTSGKAKESVLAMSLGLIDATGGIDALKGKLDAYYQAAYTQTERDALNKQAAKKLLDDYNKSIGLSGTQYIDTVAKLRAYIDAQDKSTIAGQKAIAAALGMVDALTAFSGTADDAAKKLQDQWAAFRDAAYTDAQKEAMTKRKAQSAIDAWNKSMGLSGDQYIDNILELKRFINAQDRSTEAGKKAVASALGMVDAMVAFGGTAQEIKQNVTDLRAGIKDLVGKLYGTKTTSDSTNTKTAAETALEAAKTTLDALQSRYDDEKQRIEDINNANREAHQNALDRFKQLKQLAVDLREYINGLKRSNELLTPMQKLAEVQRQYNSTLALAQSGDADAVKNIQGLADELRQSYLDVYASSKPSQDMIEKIMADLNSLAISLDAQAGTEPVAPADVGSTVLASLEAQIKAQEAVINSLQSQVNTETQTVNAAADRAANALELAKKIGELGLATDKSAWDILKANGINIKDLAADFGINVKQLDATFISKVAELSGLLNVNSLTLLNKIGVSVVDLAKAYGINTDKLDATMVNKIGALAGQLNVSSFDLLKKLGVTSQELAAAYGINTDKLNQAFLTKLDSLADVLKVSSVDLAAKLGVNIGQLGDLMANKLAALPGVPENIKAGLAPYLQNIRDAADPATLKRELQALQTYVNTLPPGIKDQLNGQLQGILGFTGDTKTNTSDTKTETTALRGIGSNINSLTVYTRDQLTGTYLAGVWNSAESTKGLTESYLKPYLEYTRKNTAALNANAASIGKSAIVSYDVGEDFIPSDRVANVHAREMVFTADQSDSVRGSVVYLLDYMPKMTKYIASALSYNRQVSRDASTVSTPVVVIEARINARRVERSEARDEVVEKLKAIESELKAIRTERSRDAAISSEQRDVLIQHGEASLEEQKQARRDNWRANRKVG